MVKFDDYGPEKILEVYDPKTKMRGFLVIDNTARGPGKGGIRMTSTVSVNEVARLARAMTWKTALAGLPFGGAKSGIVGDDKKLTKNQKEEIVKAFSRSLKEVSPKLYVAAPDMNMGEEEVKWYTEANGSMKSATGKPANLCVGPGIKCGIPHEYGSTGFGVFHAALVGAKYSNLDLKKSTIAIEGFGNVGSFAAHYLAGYGSKIIAVSDSKGTAYKKDGLDFIQLTNVKKEKGTVVAYPKAKTFPGKKIISIDADVLITAAIPDLIKKRDVKKVKAKLIVQGSNIPMKAEVEQMFHKKGVLVIPDFVANAGGVISSYAEYKGENPQYMFNIVEKKIKANTELVLKRSIKKRIKPRDAAMEIAKERVLKYMKKKGRL